MASSAMVELYFEGIQQGRNQNFSKSGGGKEGGGEVLTRTQNGRSPS